MVTIIGMRIWQTPDSYALLGRICSCAIALISSVFYLVYMDSLLFVRLVKGLIFACNTYNVKPELMTLKMLKYSNRQTGFSYPIQANRLAIIVYCLRLGLNLKSQFPSLGDSCMCWYSGVCLARTTDSPSTSPSPPDSQSQWWLNLMPLQSPSPPSNGHVNKPQRPLTPCCNCQLCLPFAVGQVFRFVFFIFVVFTGFLAVSLIRWLVFNWVGFK